MKINKIAFIVTLFALPLLADAQQPVNPQQPSDVQQTAISQQKAHTHQTTVILQWEKPTGIVRGNESSISAPYFVRAEYPGLPDDLLPAYTKSVTVPGNTRTVEITLDSLVYMPFTSDELLLLHETFVPETPEAAVTIMYDQGIPLARITVKPFGRDPLTGRPAKLARFSYTLHTSTALYPEFSNPASSARSIETSYETSTDASSNISSHSISSNSSGDTTFPVRQYAKHSRLVYGDWYKLWVRETGIHKITYDDLRNMGMILDGVNPANISMFGRGGSIMPETVGMSNYDDLTEISIRVVSANPTIFAPGDYILFYGEGPVTWKLNALTNRLDASTHPYTEAIGYFITAANYPGMRIPQADPVLVPNNATADSYTALALYEKEEISLIKSGRKWFSNKFDNYTRSLPLPDFNFPDFDPTAPVEMGFGLAGRATTQMSFNIKVNGEIINTTTIAKYTNENDFARELVSNQSFNATSGNMKVVVQFNPPNSAAIGWLDFISLNVRSKLRFHGPQMNFRDQLSVGEGKVTKFILEAESSILEIWDVTNHSYVHRIPTVKSGNIHNFSVHTPYLREFIAFDGSTFLKPEFEGKIANQDLHALKSIDMIIVTHPMLRKQADRLARLHNNMGEISAKVVSLPDIYNEFSSGHTDITAIRDFMKMLYDRGRINGTAPGYLLLFGGASYDFKDRILNNVNLVPTYESYNSIKPTISYLTDDYFAILDDGEGGGELVNGLLDIAVGRIPVRTLEQATDVVNKIEKYLTNQPETHGDWRNNVLVIADDEDRNAHFMQAESLCDTLEEYNPLYNINKVYFDAFVQNSTPGGGRYPDVNREITSHVDKGALITNYIGHGGEMGWADERVLEIVDILAWSNFNRMGLFFTATCEFSRFDNPQHTSAGELVFLNPDGGAVAMITTTRLAYSSTNQNLNESFIDTVFRKSGGIPRMGDVLKYTKNDNNVSANVRHLTLFGDPALPMALPKYSVVTTSIVDPVTLTVTDTLSANARVTVTGEVRDHANQTINGFNGEVFVKVFDKPTTVRTLGQDIESFEASFGVQKNIIYQGKAKVENGIFSITFPIPLDIDYNFGKGKISYYATDGVDDAHGYFTDFIIGGSKSVIEADETGPQITLYINDTTFIDGGLTSENPKLLAYLFDESGINTIGNGVGHDLIAIVDGDSYSSSLLNDFYVADRDSYKSGLARYQFFNLDDGPHTVTVKAWDVFNNSSVASINFVVKRDIRLNIDDVTAYPNPSKGEVSFRFRHNLFDAVLSIEIEIYDFQGELVRILNPGKIIADGYVIDEVKWDGLSNNGAVLRNGLYVCRVKVLDRNGNSSAHSVKVIMAK